jgi:serine/threonine protein kinase
MELIHTYIKKYYKNHKKYPSTKMNFYKYGRLLGKGAFGKVNLGLHLLTGRLVALNP